MIMFKGPAGAGHEEKRDENGRKGQWLIERHRGSRTISHSKRQAHRVKDEGPAVTWEKQTCYAK
jgi:hypothetical protein